MGDAVDSDVDVPELPTEDMDGDMEKISNLKDENVSVDVLFGLKNEIFSVESLIRGHVHEIHEELQKYKIQLEMVQKENAELKEALKRMEEKDFASESNNNMRNQKKQEEIDRLKKELEEEAELVVWYKQELKQTQQDVQKMQEKVDGYKKDLETKEAEQKENAKVIAALQKEVEKYKMDLQELQNMQTEVKGLKAELQQTYDEAEKCKKELLKRQEEAEEYRNELQKKQEELLQKEEAVDQLKKQLLERTSGKEDAQEEAEGYKKELQKKQEELEKLQEEVKEKEAVQENTEQELEVLKKQLADSEEEIKRLWEVLQKTQEELKLREEEANVVVLELGNKDEEVQSLTMELANMQREVQSLTLELKGKDEEVQQLAVDLQVKEAEVKRASQTLEEKNKEVSIFATQLEEMARRVELLSLEKQQQSNNSISLSALEALERKLRETEQQLETQKKKGSIQEEILIQEVQKLSRELQEKEQESKDWKKLKELAEREAELLQEEVNRLKEQYEVQINEYREVLEERDAELQLLREKEAVVNSRESEILHFRSTIAGKNVEIQELKNQLRKMKDEIKAEREKQKELQKQKEAADFPENKQEALVLIVPSLQEKQALEAKLRQTEKQLQNAEKQIKDMYNRMQKSQEERNEAVNQLNLLNEAVKAVEFLGWTEEGQGDFKQKLQEALQTIKQQSLKLADLEHKNTLLMAQLEEKQDSRGDTTAQLKQLEVLVDNLRCALSELTEKNVQSKQQNIEQIEQISKYKHDLQEEKKLHQETLQKLKEKQDQLMASERHIAQLMERLQEQNSKLRNKEQMEEELQKTKIQLAEIVSEIAAVESQLNSKQEEIEFLKQELRTAEAKNKRNQEIINNLQKSLLETQELLNITKSEKWELIHAIQRWTESGAEYFSYSEHFKEDSLTADKNLFLEMTASPIPKEKAKENSNKQEILPRRHRKYNEGSQELKKLFNQTSKIIEVKSGEMDSIKLQLKKTEAHLRALQRDRVNYLADRNNKKLSNLNSNSNPAQNVSLLKNNEKGEQKVEEKILRPPSIDSKLKDYHQRMRYVCVSTQGSLIDLQKTTGEVIGNWLVL